MSKLPSSMFVNGEEIKVIRKDGVDYYSLTNMTKGFSAGGALIEKWMRTKHTIDLLTTWEELNNPNFNSPFNGGFMENYEYNPNFSLSIKEWVNKTNAVGIFAVMGKQGGTYASKLIAQSFAMALSATYQVLFLTETDRREKLLADLLVQLEDPEFYLKRRLAAENYSCQTDSAKDKLVPLRPYLPEGVIYAEEADLLNVILFGLKDKQWRELNPELAKSNNNQRDFATVNQLLVLSQMQIRNSMMIDDDVPYDKRKELLTEYAKQKLDKLNSLKSVDKFKQLKAKK